MSRWLVGLASGKSPTFSLLEILTYFLSSNIKYSVHTSHTIIIFTHFILDRKFESLEKFFDLDLSFYRQA